MNEHIQNPFAESEIDIREYLRILYEKRWLVVSVTVILCTLSLIRSFMMAPVYEASAKVLIQNTAPNVVNMQEVQSEAYAGREYYQTQYKILKSRVIAERVNEALGGYIPWSEWDGRKKTKTDLTDQQRANALLKRVTISPLPNTQLVNVTVEDVDPGLAAKITNMWSENYIAYILDVKFDASRNASEWLQEKIKNEKDKLEESEHKLQKYRKKHDLLMDTGDDIGMMDRLLERKADLEIELSEKKEYYKDKHPEIIGIRSEIASVDEKIRSEREKGIETGEKSIDYNMLKRAVATNKDIYGSLLKRIGETEVTGQLETTNISVVDKAIIPESPSRPKKLRDLIIAFVVGIFAGSGAAFFMNGIDQSVKSPEDLKRSVGLPALSSIAMPVEESDRNAIIELIAHKVPRSTIAEAYRSLRTSIMFTAVEHKRKVLLFTS
ncbi:MAG: exopolysaccharide transport family protein, partial [Candidatus Omnitrophica bacterium]|nr:exopolysaccharide transport family protein [Candidatus Omnitrophota bacterium]